MKPTDSRQQPQDRSRPRAPLEALSGGTEVKSHNETPVPANIVEFEPFLKIRKATRSSNLYEKFE